MTTYGIMKSSEMFDLCCAYTWLRNWKLNFHINKIHKEQLSKNLKKNFT